MRPSVLNGFMTLTTDKEGAISGRVGVPWMYLDMHKDKDGNLDPLVTTGLGNLIDGGSKGDVYNLPWTHGDNGPFASRGEIDAAWNLVKSRADLVRAGLGGGSQAFANLTDLRLSDDAILGLVRSKLTAFENRLRERFGGYDAWPADAQLGLLSMAWAMGPNFRYPKFEAAANALLPDFDVMARESAITGNSPRTEAHDTLFSNAAAVLRDNGDPALLYFPNSFSLSSRQAAIAKAGGISIFSLLIAGGAMGGGYLYAKKKGWV